MTDNDTDKDSDVIDRGINKDHSRPFYERKQGFIFNILNSVLIIILINICIYIYIYIYIMYYII